ncbi:hypothetical protein [Alteribacter aurantiacus]|uniref:hypothetical protein n=1 Tax=Alteribacter aurantiacus TaxID=254410 RepID=UPI00041E66A3|nr:hypothetical protein [Alteribacter aurantiacus]
MQKEDFYTLSEEDEHVPGEEKPFKVHFRLTLNDPVFARFAVDYSKRRSDWLMLIQEKIVYRLGFDFLDRYAVSLIPRNRLAKKLVAEHSYSDESLHNLVKNGVWTFHLDREDLVEVVKKDGFKEIRRTMNVYVSQAKHEKLIHY